MAPQQDPPSRCVDLPGKERAQRVGATGADTAAGSWEREAKGWGWGWRRYGGLGNVTAETLALKRLGDAHTFTTGTELDSVGCPHSSLSVNTSVPK